VLVYQRGDIEKDKIILAWMRYLYVNGLHLDCVEEALSNANFCPNYHLPTVNAYFRCRFCEANRLGRRNPYLWHSFWQPSYQASLAKGPGGVIGSKEKFLMKRPEKETGKKNSKPVCPDAAFAKQYPSIAQFMVDDRWDDGKARKVGTITINFSQGCCTISLADHDQEQSCYTTANTLPEALGLLEDALAAEKVAWRLWKRGK